MGERLLHQRKLQHVHRDSPSTGVTLPLADRAIPTAESKLRRPALALLPGDSRRKPAASDPPPRGRLAAAVLSGDNSAPRRGSPHPGERGSKGALGDKDFHPGLKLGVEKRSGRGGGGGRRSPAKRASGAGSSPPRRSGRIPASPVPGQGRAPRPSALHPRAKTAGRGAPGCSGRLLAAAAGLTWRRDSQLSARGRILRRRRGSG